MERSNHDLSSTRIFKPVIGANGIPLEGFPLMPIDTYEDYKRYEEYRASLKSKPSVAAPINEQSAPSPQPEAAAEELPVTSAAAEADGIEAGKAERKKLIDSWKAERKRVGERHNYEIIAEGASKD